MSFPTFIKDPDATLDYTRDWTDWLAASGADAIVSSEWITPAGIVVEAQSNTENTATIWVSGGTLGQRYQLVNRITTNGGRIDDRTIVIKIAQQ